MRLTKVERKAMKLVAETFIDAYFYSLGVMTGIEQNEWKELILVWNKFLKRHRIKPRQWKRSDES